MSEETPLQKALRAAKEKEATQVNNSPDIKSYKDLSYEEYLAQKGAPKKKVQKVSSQDSGNGLPTSTEPSQTSQDSQPFDIGLNNAKTQSEFIGEDNAARIRAEVGSGPLKLDMTNVNKSKIPFAGLNQDEINRLTPEQVAQEEVKRNKSSESSIGNLAGQFFAEAGKSFNNDVGNIAKAVSNDIASNRNDFSKLTTNEKLNVIEEQQNPFTRIKNLFNTLTEAISFNEEDGMAGTYAKEVKKLFPQVRNVITPNNVYQQWDNIISNMSPSQRATAIEKINQVKNAADENSKGIENWQANNPVPNNIFTTTTKAIGQMAPDILLMMLTEGGSSEVTAAKYANMFSTKYMPKVITNYAPKAAAFIERGIKSSATKVFAAKGGIEAAANNEDVAIGAAKGAASGMYMHSLGEVAGVVAKPIAKVLGKTGLPSEYSNLFAIPTANAATFASAKAVTTPITEGRLATKDELYQEIGVGIGMSAIGLKQTFEKHRDVNKLAREVLVNDPIVGLKDVLRTPNDKLLENFDPQMDVANLSKARDEIRKSIIVEPDLTVKQELMSEAAQIQQKIDARLALEEVLLNKNSLKQVFEKTEYLNPEQKQRIDQRIEDINSAFLAARNEAKTQAAGEKVEKSLQQTEVIADKLANVETPEQVAALKNEAVDAITNLAQSQAELDQLWVNPNKLSVGDEIQINENQKGFIKELLPDNKAIVGINKDGIYSEQTIELPKNNEKAISENQPQATEKQNIETGDDSPKIAETGKNVVQPQSPAGGTPSNAIEIPTEYADKSPEDLARMYNEEVMNPSLTSIEQAISTMPFGTSRESYMQFGDRNNITASKARSYFKKGGLGLDVIAQEINNNQFGGNEVVTPQDLVDFIDSYPNGPGTVIQPSGNSTLRSINDAYFAKTGKKLNQRSARDIVEQINQRVDQTTENDLQKIDEQLAALIAEEGVTLDNFQNLENGLRFVYGDQPVDDMLSYLIFGPNSKNNEQSRKEGIPERKSESENSRDIGESGSMEGVANTGGTGGSSPKNGEVQVGEGTGGLVNEGAPSTNPKADGNVQPDTIQSNEGTKDSNLHSTTDSGTGDVKTEIDGLRSTIDQKTKLVSSLQYELNKLYSSLEKNLRENQRDIFGQNKTQSLFDDKSQQQKIYEEKANELTRTQQELAAEKQSLKSLEENQGQIDLNLPESVVDIGGGQIDISKTDEDQDGQIIAQSILNPFKVISEVQKLVDKIENKFTEKIASKVADNIAENLKAWRKSKSALKQISSSYLTSILGGIARTNKDANAKLGLIGGKNLAVYNMGKFMKAAYEIVDNNTESLERVHVVMDPEFYQQGLGGQSNTFKSNVPPNLTYDNLTESEKQLHDQLRAMLDDIHFKNYVLGFISKDTFDKYKDKYVPRMYETFELPTEVKEILDTYSAQVGDKLNLNPFKKRKGLENLSEDSKNAIVKDPVYLAAKRQMELDTNSAIMTYINHIARDNRALVHSGDANVPFNYEKLEGKAYGALDGKYVPSYLAEDLRGYFFVNDGLNRIYDTIKAYDRTWARKGIKKGLTVFNPFVQIGNFTSNVVFAQMAGIDFVRWFGNTPNALKQLKEKGPAYEALLKAGLIGTDVISSDLAPNTERANSLLQQAEALKNQGLFGKILSGIKSIDKGLLSLYSGNDDYAKINAYQILKEQGYSEEEAVKKVYDGFQNYATVGKFWDVISKTPVFGNPFQKFSADLMRITGNAVTKKPLSTSLYLAALYFLPGLILNSIGWDSDETELEKELREGRPFIPKMDLGAVNIPLVYKTKYGELNLARYITPYFYFDNGEDGALGSMTERFSPIKTVATQGYGKGNERDVLFGQDPILGTLYNAIILDTDFRGKSISDPEATRFRASGVTDEEKWQNIFVNAARTWVPNGGLIQDTYLNAKYGEDYYGRTRNMAQAMINFAVKIQRFEEGDYKKTAEKQLYSLANELKGSAETIKNTMVLNQRQRQKTERDFKEGKKTLADYQNSLQKLDKTLKSRLVELNSQLESNQKKFIDFKSRYSSILNR